jgi:hypothetical protein
MAFSDRCLSDANTRCSSWYCDIGQLFSHCSYCWYAPITSIGMNVIVTTIFTVTAVIIHIPLDFHLNSYVKVFILMIVSTSFLAVVLFCLIWLIPRFCRWAYGKLVLLDYPFSWHDWRGIETRGEFWVLLILCAHSFGRCLSSLPDSFLYLQG